MAVLRIVIATFVIALACAAAGFAYLKSTSPRAPAISDPFVGRDGAQEARASLARGKLIVLEYGLYLPWDAERREVAQERFGIEYREIAGCVVTEPLVEFATAYNHVMQPAIITRFGADVFAIVDREGKALHEKRWVKKEANQSSEPTPTSRGDSS